MILIRLTQYFKCSNRSHQVLLYNILLSDPKHGSLEKRAAWSSIRAAALCNVASQTISSLAQKAVSQKTIDSKVRAIFQMTF